MRRVGTRRIATMELVKNVEKRVRNVGEGNPGIFSVGSIFPMYKIVVMTTDLLRIENG